MNYIHRIMDDSQIQQAEQQKPDTKEFIFWLHLWETKLIHCDEIRSVVAWGRERGDELTTEGHEETFLGDENFLYLDLDGGYMSAYIYQHTYAHLK